MVEQLEKRNESLIDMKPDPAKQVVERIAALLKRQGHGSKVRLAKHCEIDPTHISHWLSKPPRRLPGPRNQIKLTEYLAMHKKK